MNTERTFPEDNDTLYREMTAYMPNCYFPTSLGEDAIHEFAGGEFVRIRDIICREYGFDEDRHIEEYAGVSPFDFVRDDIEQEIYRRIRKDYTQLGAISIRKSLLEKIRHAVERENNIIGTFYRNRGVHYRDGEPAEYETSPIVVIHNTGNYGYGGYESATVYELSSTGRENCSARSMVKAGKILTNPSRMYKSRGYSRSPIGWKSTGSSPPMLMTTRLPYVKNAVQTISRLRHG